MRYILHLLVSTEISKYLGQDSEIPVLTYMFLNASGPGVEKVINPKKYANMLKPIPFALMTVGKISEHQTKDGASMNWKSKMKR